MLTIPHKWVLRKRFWAKWESLRHSLAKPTHIVAPKPNRDLVKVVPFKEAHPEIPMEKVLVFERLPPDESKVGMRILIAVGLWINRLLPEMKTGKRALDRDMDQDMQPGLSPVYIDSYRTPRRPAPFQGDGPTDLGVLAVKGPYCVFIERGSDGRLQWDFRHLAGFEHHPGLCSLGLRVVFKQSDDGKQLLADEIQSTEFGVVRPGDAGWGRAVVLATCAATTQLALTRHFNYVHLISGNHWDVAARNCLDSTHPLYRLLWPHIFNSFYTNYGVTRIQLRPDGEFVNMFSFSHPGLVKYFDAMYERYDIRMTDPELDWQRRGLEGATFEHPGQQNLLETFTVMHDHARRYIHAYYASDEELRHDADVGSFLQTLNDLIPNGIASALLTAPTRDGLARLIGAYLYEGSVIHELAGTALWDYQLWPDRNPTRVYKDGRPIPDFVHQRVLNNNFALQLERAPLLADYGEVALDPTGRKLFTQFFSECAQLQVRYDLERWNSAHDRRWRMEPMDLEISMNG